MENRYQEFLRQTLRAGLLELKKNPSADEVVGIPIEAFDILAQAFCSGLSEELKQTEPKIDLPHNLSDPAYLEALLAKIDILLSPETKESVKETSTTNIRQLVAAYEEAKKREVSFKKQQAGWQEKFNQQIKEYNNNLIFYLQQQLKETLPSLSEEIRNQLAKDITHTIQDQVFQDRALPKIQYSYETKEMVQKVAETALKTYASTAKEILEKPELATQIAQKIAQDQEAATWEARSAQISATTLPATYKVSSALSQSPNRGRNNQPGYRQIVSTCLNPTIYSRRPIARSHF